MLKASQKCKNSERYLLILFLNTIFTQVALITNSIHFVLVFLMLAYRKINVKIFTSKKVVESITFPTVFGTYHLVATVFGSNFLNQKDIYL